MGSVLLIHLPLVDMREAPACFSKIVSQALFGEEIRLQELQGRRALIVTSDGYSGWVEAGSFIERPLSYSTDLEISRLKAHLYATPDTEFGPIFSLPYGARLRAIDSSDPRWSEVLLPDGRRAYVQKGDVEPEPFDLLNFSKKFLGLPYTWGGRSSFGFDCSGYVQMLYTRLGIALPRDAKQQMGDPKGRFVSEASLTLGDLLFWGKSKTEIKHVGMFLQGQEFIHTSARENKPYLRISKLTDFEWSGENSAISPFRTARRFI